MKLINIYTYSRIQNFTSTEYINVLSGRTKKVEVKGSGGCGQNSGLL